MLEWQRLMEHERAVRNALAVCNGKEPSTFKDTAGSLEDYRPSTYRFIGKIYWKYMYDHGHDDAQYKSCACVTGRAPINRLPDQEGKTP